MEDRSVEFPQRYQLKKVEGTDDIYDIIPAPGTITAEGTLINKKTLLQDATAALFKLSGETALPDKVFEILSKAALVGEDGGLVTTVGGEVTQVKVAISSYVGTGKIGKSNPNSLTFDFPPKIAFIFSKKVASPVEGNSGSIFPIWMWSDEFSSCAYISNDTFTLQRDAYGKINGNTISWYYDSSTIQYQLNVSGYRYYCLALG